MPDKRKVFTRSPRVTAGDFAALKAIGPLSPTIVALAMAESQRGRALLPVPRDQLLHFVPVRIRGDDLAALRDVVEARGLGPLTDAELLARLVRTALNAEESAPAAEAEPDPRLTGAALLDRPAIGRPARPEQLHLLSDIQNALGLGRVILAEAATGTGKGLVLAGAAYAEARAGKRVAVASPTHQVSRQTVSDFKDLCAQHGPIAHEVIYGRGEFVSAGRLRALLDEAGQDLDIGQEQLVVARDWLEDALRQGEQAPWLAASLDAVCPGLARGYTLQMGEPGDPGEEAYQRQFARAEQSQVLFVSHAMLAHDALARLRALRRGGEGLQAKDEEDADEEDLVWYQRQNTRLLSFGDAPGILPRYSMLVVDEAHVLDRAFADAMSAQISLRMMLRRIESLAPDAATRASARAGYEAVQAQAQGGNLSVSANRVGVDPRARESVRGMSVLAAAATRALEGDEDPSGERRLLQADLRGVRMALQLASHRVGQLRYTPHRRWPTLLVGPRYVSAPLDFLWRACDAAAAVSATLYIDGAGGVPNAEYMRDRLSVPRDRLTTHVPICPPWVLEPVTLYLPEVVAGSGRAHPWCPPADTESQAESARYHQALATAVAQIASAPDRGGMLVLCTSYAFIEAMRAGGHFASDTLYQAPGVSLDAYRKRFSEMAAAGGRPLWFATGAAWVGMDLQHPNPSLPAAQDHVLTHVVIVRAPFMTEVNSVSVARAERAGGFYPEVVRCALQLKQAMGRLVRRPGVGRRHLYILDPRIADTGIGYGPVFDRLLRRYPVRRLISPTAPEATMESVAPKTFSRLRRNLI